MTAFEWEFGAAPADHSGGRAPYALESWDDALRVLYETVSRGLVVIDEFPYLIKAHGPVPSLVQRALDPRGRAHRGSDTSATVLTCYGGAEFDADLRAASAADPRVLLVDLATLYG
ncbi:hypothetical protein [Planomonospora algeriensis]